MLAAVAPTLQRWPIVGRRSELEVFEEALCSGKYAGLVIHEAWHIAYNLVAETMLEGAASARPIRS